MKYAVNESAPLPLTVGQSQYLYGTNEWIPINDTRNQPVLLSDVMTVFKHPDAKLTYQNGLKTDYIMSRQLVVPVNKENAIKSGIVSPKFADAVPEYIVLQIPEDKDHITKPELFMLDLLSNYQWDRPLNMLNMGGDLDIGIKEYLMSEGVSSKFVPFKNSVSSLDVGIADTDRLYELMTEKFSWDALARDDYFIDYQNLYTFLGVMSQRGLFTSMALAFEKVGEMDRAVEMLDKCQEVMKNYPLETVCLGFSSNDYIVVEMVSMYYRLGQPEKARNLAVNFFNSLLESARFYLEFYEFAQDEFELCGQYIYFLQDEVRSGGDEELAKKIGNSFEALIDIATGGAAAAGGSES